MGLDMYLNKRTYVGAIYEHRGVTGTIDVSVMDKKLPIQFERITHVEERVGYWRKANAIHQWFVDNCQEGIDDCRDAYVSTDQLKELLATVEKVLASCKLVDGVVENGMIMSAGDTEFHPVFEAGKYIVDASVAKELLPAQSGFFFGSTDYDQWYYEDLVSTKEIIEKALAEDNSNADFYYHSSW